MIVKYKLKIIVLLFASSVIGTIHAQLLKKGIWRGILTIDAENKIDLPFNFEVNYKNSKTQLTIINADERILVDELFFKKDSLIIKLPVFDTEFRTRIFNDSLVGVWINYARKDKNIIPFKAFANNKNRFLNSKNNNTENVSESNFFDGKWEVTFSPGSNDSSKAIGVFNKQTNEKLIGTFLTETGDYRFLEGTQIGNKLYLSGFDGSHAFLFMAEKDLTNNKLNGFFYSGISWKENWVAIKNDTFQLRSAESITKLNPGFETIYFKFPNSENKLISLLDERYKNKVVILQLLGSWCPNCMDETAYLSKIYNRYNKSGLEIIGLAYERTNDFNKASGLVTRLKKRFNVEYEILITGLTGKDKASENFPMLNKITAFPTTIIIDKAGKVNTIHTGFSGPATGKAFEEFSRKTESLIDQLLKK
jgi:thiol-disulfide isomerase/thioredoxin